MPPVSSIKRLAPELREAIDDQLIAGRSLDAVTEAAHDMGAEVSRSAIGRHNLMLKRAMERSRNAREIAEVLARSVTKDGEKTMLQGNAELMHAILQQAIDNAAKPEAGASPKDVMMLGIAFDKIARAIKAGAEVERLREESTTVVDTVGTTSGSKQIEVVFVQPPVKDALENPHKG